MLKTQPNEKRCHRTKQIHRLNLKPCCPVSGNPLDGSFIEIEYDPKAFHLEVASLREYVDMYIGGHEDVRSMEGMIQQITYDCANAVQTLVRVMASLNIAPDQQMILTCSEHPSPATQPEDSSR